MNFPHKRASDMQSIFMLWRHHERKIGTKSTGKQYIWHKNNGMRCMSFYILMTSSNGNIFCFTGLLCGEFTGHRSRGALMFSLISAWWNGWAYSRDGGDLIGHGAHYDANVMELTISHWYWNFKTCYLSCQNIGTPMISTCHFNTLYSVVPASTWMPDSPQWHNNPLITPSV